MEEEIRREENYGSLDFNFLFDEISSRLGI
jgi:hypothetical protein